jgi:hypothetical protein
MQPHVMKSGKRTPIGEAIEGYYPAVVDSTTFNAVRYALSKIDKSKSGRKSEGLMNLFSGLIKCGLDGLSMHYSTKQKNTAYLICSGRNQGCDNPLFRYDEFQDIFFKFFKGFNLNFVFNESEDAKKIDSLNSMIQSKHGDMIQTNRSINNITKAIEVGSNLESLVNRLTALEQDKRKLQDEIDRLQGEIDHAPTNPVGKPDLEGVDLAILTPDQRLKINQDLKRIIESIRVVSQKIKGRGNYLRQIEIRWINGQFTKIVKDDDEILVFIDEAQIKGLSDDDLKSVYGDGVMLVVVEQIK